MAELESKPGEHEDNANEPNHQSISRQTDDPIQTHNETSSQRGPGKRVKLVGKANMIAKPSDHPGEVVMKISDRDDPMMAAAAAGASPFHLKRVLVPVDFSDCSLKALRYAIPFARHHMAAVTLLHVVPTNYAIGEYGGIDYAALELAMKTSSEEQLSKLALEEVGRTVPCTTEVRIGSPAREIVDMAKETLADVIVIATHGRTGIQHMLLGSVVEHVVRKAPCPVFVVRENEREIL